MDMDGKDDEQQEDEEIQLSAGLMMQCPGINNRAAAISLMNHYYRVCLKKLS